jgi:hypothetical protein
MEDARNRRYFGAERQLHSACLLVKDGGRRRAGAQLVLLLLGGDKSTQTADVTRAQESRKAYQEGKPRGKTK